MYINPPSKLLHHLDRIAELRETGQTTAPVNVEIDLSNRCSLGCEWCHFAHTHTRGPLAHKQAVNTGDLMDTALALDIVDQLTAAGVRSVVWSGGGEPTLHPDFDRIASATTLPQGMYTNGAHITPSRALMLKRRFSWVYVSLDASDRDWYAKMKGVAASRFDDALAGIQALVDADGEATIGVGFLLSENNFYTAPRMVALGRQLGADYIQFRPVIRYNNDLPSQREGPVSWISTAARMLEDLSAQDGVILDVSRFKALRDWRGHGYETCWWSGLQTVITPDGRVWVCLNKRGFDGAALGDLSKEPFSAIWQRAQVAPVNEACRVMCRGHIPNGTLKTIMGNSKHGEFI